MDAPRLDNNFPGSFSQENVERARYDYLKIFYTEGKHFPILGFKRDEEYFLVGGSEMGWTIHALTLGLAEKEYNLHLNDIVAAGWAVYEEGVLNLIIDSESNVHKWFGLEACLEFKNHFPQINLKRDLKYSTYKSRDLNNN